MYFAFEYLSPEFFQKTTNALEELQAVHCGKPFNIFVLIDGAFDEDFLTKMFGTGSRCISLYEGTPLSGFGKAALFLAQIDTEKVPLTSWIAKLVDLSGNRPMWSVIAAAIDIDKFAKHLTPFLIAKSDDSLEWPVRWGDVRVLPQLLDELDSRFVDDLLKPIYSWLVPSRNGNLLAWHGQGRFEYRTVEYEKLPMRETTFARLVEISEPDMILSQIYERQPEYLRLLPPSECHRRVARQLRIADKFNMEQPAVRQHFSAISLFLREDFIDLPALKELLVKVSKGSDYMNQIGALNELFWTAATVDAEEIKCS